MSKSLPTYQPLELIPTSESPLTLKDYTAELRRGHEEFFHAHDIEKSFRFIYLEDKDKKVGVNFDCRWLTLSEIERLAAGEEISTPCGEVESLGRLRLLRGHEKGVLAKILLEFIPDQPALDGMPFRAWFCLRFPEHASFSSELDNEDWWVMFHGMWAEETHPAATLAPDDSLLWRAALNNQERLLHAILERQPTIQADPDSEKHLIETAHGVALENTGMFGAEAGFISGCHRLFRDDDFCLAEDTETWVPRAQRIADRLEAAGAIDYSPLLEACRAGRMHEVKAMLQRGFPPNFAIYGHTTPLLEAVDAGHEDLCDLLLSHGADPNMQLPFESSMIFGGAIHPLRVAIGHPAILKLLLDAGADYSALHDDTYETPVLLMPHYKSHEEAEAVFSLVDFDSLHGQHRRTGVFYLDHTGLEQCRPFISTELLNEHDSRGMTPLLHAITFDNVAKVRKLIQMGADPARPGMIWNDEANCILNDVETGQVSTQWLTPIQAALMVGSQELIQFLHELGTSAPRYTHSLKIPNIVSEEDYQQLRNQLQLKVEALVDVEPLQTAHYEPLFPDDRARHCEILLATLLLNQPQTTASDYSEFVKQTDLVTWAEEQELDPALIAPFRDGAK